MRIAEGPRPWPIWVFALVTTGLLVNNLIDDLREPVVALARYGWIAPSFDWSEDALIVVASAGFTIKMIPVVLIWAFAVRLARWLVVAMAILPLPIRIFELVNHVSKLRADGYGESTISTQLTVVAFGYAVQFGLLALLFLPSSNRWFARKQKVDVHAFD